MLQVPAQQSVGWGNKALASARALCYLGKMKKVIVLRGLPASGKTTYAKQLINDEYAGRSIRINNDDISAMLFGKQDTYTMPKVGPFLFDIRMTLLESALKQNWIELIIVDNTNLKTSTVTAMEKLAKEYGAIFEVDDRFLAIPVRECVARDRERLFPVGEKVIVEMADLARFLKPWSAQ